MRVAPQTDAHCLTQARIYKSGTKFDKDGVFYASVLVDHSLFNVTDRSAAKTRKDMFQPYFSKAAIQRLESTIKAKVAKFFSSSRQCLCCKQRNGHEPRILVFDGGCDDGVLQLETSRCPGRP